MTKRIKNMLEYLILNKGIVLSKEKLADFLAGDDFKSDINYEKSVKDVISKIRKRIGDDDQKIIETRVGQGYILDEVIKIFDKNEAKIDISNTIKKETKYITDNKDYLIKILNKLNKAKPDDNEKYDLIFIGIGIIQEIRHDLNDFFNDPVVVDFENYLIEDLNKNLSFQNDDEYYRILNYLFFLFDIFALYFDFISLKKDNKFTIYNFIHHMCLIMYLYDNYEFNFVDYKMFFNSLYECTKLEFGIYIDTLNALRNCDNIDLNNFNDNVNRDLFIYLKKCPETKFNNFVSFITFLHESEKSILDFYTTFCTQLHEAGDL